MRRRRFPASAIKAADYARSGAEEDLDGVAILSRRGAPVETSSALPGDPADKEARYIEAAIEGILICCLYLPNGNPQPGPKFDYKLAWFQRLEKHATALLRRGRPGDSVRGFQRRADGARHLSDHVLGR